jgi:exodeoxyribonuclease VII large subunit
MANQDASVSDDIESHNSDIVTVETVNNEIADLLEQSHTITHEYIVGDVSDCRTANGHLHFDLVSGDASIHCVIFSVQHQQLTATPDENMHVAVQGDISYYEARGSCSIIVTNVVHMGESEYTQVYAENKRLLAADGLLADSQKQSLPELPETVGLVTSANSDARIDAVTAICNRYPGVDINIHDSTVQGAGAIQELISGISTLDSDTTVDVIIITRGGGADKTLRVFNETPLCRVIADTETPVAVGIGHEDDQTLAGEVADHRLMTPTHAGEVVPERAQLNSELTQLSHDLPTAYHTALSDKLTTTATALNTAYQSAISQQLQQLETALDHAASRHFETQLTETQNRLHTAYQTLEQRKQHEQELEQTAEEIRTEVTAQTEAEMVTQRRRYMFVIVLLILIIIGLVVFNLV